MDADNYAAANIQAALIAEVLEKLPLGDMLDAQARAEAIGPVMDPTLWRSKAQAFRVDTERARILHTAQVALRKLRESQS